VRAERRRDEVEAQVLADEDAARRQADAADGALADVGPAEACARAASRREEKDAAPARAQVRERRVPPEARGERRRRRADVLDGQRAVGPALLLGRVAPGRVAEHVRDLERPELFRKGQDVRDGVPAALAKVVVRQVEVAEARAAGAAQPGRSGSRRLRVLRRLRGAKPLDRRVESPFRAAADEAAAIASTPSSPRRQ
jgi:hypothetical protein